MNKEQFYRKDYDTFKPKYFLFCREKVLESGSLVNKYSDLLAQNKNNNYICRIIIKEVKDDRNTM